jgi:hypothetical protein
VTAKQPAVKKYIIKLSDEKRERQRGAWLCSLALDGLVGIGRTRPFPTWMPVLPFKLNQARRHHIARQQHKVANWAAYEAGLPQRGSLMVWFTDEGSRGLGSRATRGPRWPAFLFAAGDPDGADPARCVPSCLSAS